MQVWRPQASNSGKKYNQSNKKGNKKNNKKKKGKR
jgi:hypothetical protein